MSGSVRRPGSIAPAALAALLGGLAACATDDAAPSGPPPIPAVSAPEALAARLPASAASFQRGAVASLSEGRGGREVAYATTGRTQRAAGFIQVLAPAAPLPDGPNSPEASAEFTRWTQEVQQGGGPHRRLRLVREADLPAAAPLFRCAELEGTYGRQAVESFVCVGAAGGQMLRLRVSMPRRDPAVAQPRAFVEEVARALRGG
ncbi:MAG: hypothetical protein K2X11_21805 [Acetobacteraceae bacterium]|nr:hypothetical protein [Acetobacteraceae bacterium]